MDIQMIVKSRSDDKPSVGGMHPPCANQLGRLSIKFAE